MAIPVQHVNPATPPVLLHEAAAANAFLGTPMETVGYPEVWMTAKQVDQQMEQSARRFDEERQLAAQQAAQRRAAQNEWEGRLQEMNARQNVRHSNKLDYTDPETQKQMVDTLARQL